MRQVLAFSALLLVALLVGGCGTPQSPVRVAVPNRAAPAPVPSSKETRVAMTLASGVRVILEENHLSPVVAMQAWVGVGSADDPPDKAGLAHLFEHTLLQSTQRRPAGQIAREIDAMAGALDSWSSFDQTVYQLVLAAPYLDAGLDILADALVNASFDPGELERARAGVLAELRQAAESPERAASQALFRAAFPAHPYGRPLAGSEAAVAALTREQLLAAYQRSYVGPNIALLVVGDFDASALKGKIAGVFAGVRRGSPPPARSPEPAQAAARTVVIPRDLAESRLLLAYRIPAAGHDDTAALDLLAVILGQGEGSRLDLGPARGRQLVESASAYTFASRDGGLFIVSATMPPGRLEDPARALSDEVLRLAREEVSEAELGRARALLETGIARDRSTPAGYARRLGFFASVAGGLEREEGYLTRVAALSPGDLREVAARYLRVAQQTCAALVSARSVTRGRGAADPAKLGARLDSVWAAAEARADRRQAPPPALPAPGGVVRVVLPSGLRVLVLQDSTLPLINLHAVWAGGLRYEDPRSNGISNLLSVMLTRGTRGRASWQLGATLADLHASLSGFSTRDSLGLRVELPSDEWERGIEILADCLANPRLSEDDLERERRAILEQIRVRDRNPIATAMRLFAATLWSRHPYRLPELGTLDAVAALTHRRLLDHYRRYYGVSGLTIAIVGNVDATRAVARIQALLGDLPAAALDPRAVAAEPPRSEPAEVFAVAPGEDAQVVLGYPGVTARDPDRFTLAVLSEILSGPSGRLAAALREQRLFTSGPTASSVEGIDPGYVAVTFACRPQALDLAVRAVRAEVARLVEGGVSPDEVARARRYLVGAHALGLERRSAVAAALAFHEASGAGWQELGRYAAGLQRVTGADVQRVARKFLDPRREVVAVARPADEAAPVARRGRGDGAPDAAAALKPLGAARVAAP